MDKSRKQFHVLEAVRLREAVDEYPKGCIVNIINLSCSGKSADIAEYREETLGPIVTVSLACLEHIQP